MVTLKSRMIQINDTILLSVPTLVGTLGIPVVCDCFLEKSESDINVTFLLLPHLMSYRLLHWRANCLGTDNKMLNEIFLARLLQRRLRYQCYEMHLMVYYLAHFGRSFCTHPQGASPKPLQLRFWQPVQMMCSRHSNSQYFEDYTLERRYLVVNFSPKCLFAQWVRIYVFSLEHQQFLQQLQHWHAM